MPRPIIHTSLFIILGLLIGWFASLYFYTYIQINWRTPSGQSTLITPPPKPLEAFTFENLSKRTYNSNQINLSERKTTAPQNFKSYDFTYQSDGKTVSGLANIPINHPPTGGFPVIIMLRGYVDPEIYITGVGTWRAAEIFATNGFITLSPDFLGYGQSDPPEPDIFWERLNRPVQVLNLIASLNTIPSADINRIGLWGHSNGGQIAISILEITAKPYPTTLWAPVTKPFPYSILYYTDEADDHGQRLRVELARFESNYNVQNYSLTNYLSQITAPLQLHQGTLDDAVPLDWSNEFTSNLKKLQKPIQYYIYPNADHNLQPSWQTVIKRDLEFFRQNLQS